MKLRIIPIGNSRGIRIPKVILEHCHVEDEVELETEGDRIIVKPVRRAPRKGWEKAFLKMKSRKEDRMLIDDGLDLDSEDWEWS